MGYRLAGMPVDTPMIDRDVPRHASASLPRSTGSIRHRPSGTAVRTSKISCSRSRRSSDATDPCRSSHRHGDCGDNRCHEADDTRIRDAGHGSGIRASIAAQSGRHRSDRIAPAMRDCRHGSRLVPVGMAGRPYRAARLDHACWDHLHIDIDLRRDARAMSGISSCALSWDSASAGCFRSPMRSWRKTIPARHRGWLMVLVGGDVAAAYVSRAGSPRRSCPSSAGASSGCSARRPALLLILLNRWIPESPRFCSPTAVTAEARAVMERYGAACGRAPRELRPSRRQQPLGRTVAVAAVEPDHSRRLARIGIRTGAVRV